MDLTNREALKLLEDGLRAIATGNAERAETRLGKLHDWLSVMAAEETMDILCELDGGAKPSQGDVKRYADATASYFGLLVEFDEYGNPAFYAK